MPHSPQSPRIPFVLPVQEIPDPHVHNLSLEMEWLGACIQARLAAVKEGTASALLPPPQSLLTQGCHYGAYVTEKDLDTAERMLLALAIAPYAAPDMVQALQTNPSIAQKAKLIRTSHHNAMLPSGETALFLLAHDELAHRLELLHLFSAEHTFYRESIVETSRVLSGEPDTLGALVLAPYYRDLFVHNRELLPRYNENFPADIITTNLNWDDLVLSNNTSNKLHELKLYLEYHARMVAEWEMGKHARAGCRILFHGDSGTGKTLVATLLGQLTHKQVFRVDVSLVTSKYVGETSNRLRNLFSTAENKGWILFFDEGDAILGQRTALDGDMPTNHYANHDVAYLLQRIENYNGIVVVATNFRANIDAAFTRRFDHIIKFDTPDTAKLVTLWNRNLPPKVTIDPKVDLNQLLQRFQLSPASIIKALYRACLVTFGKSATEIGHDDLLLCLKDEEMQSKGMGRPSSR